MKQKAREELRCPSRSSQPCVTRNLNCGANSGDRKEGHCRGVTQDFSRTNKRMRRHDSNTFLERLCSESMSHSENGSNFQKTKAKCKFHLRPCFLQFNVYTNHLGILLRCRF